jgi:type I restriction enzyme S subunit
VTASEGGSFLAAVPAHWTITRFGRDIRISEGQVDPREEPWASTVLIAPNHIESGTGRLLGLETAAAQGADSGKYVARAGQVLYSKIRPGLNKVAVAPLDCLCSADMYAITPRSGVDARYLAYYMRSRPFHAYASVTADRVKMPKINREELAAAPWARPPLGDQQAIADFLDEQTSRIDTLIDKQTRLIVTLRERRLRVREELATLVGVGDRLKWRLTEVDERAGSRANDLPLMSVSIDWGVRRRDSITSDEHRADDLTDYKVCSAGDIVVNRMRAFQGALGVAPEQGLVSPDYAVLRARSATANCDWIVEVMRTRAFIGEMILRIRGIGGIESGSVRTPRINVADLLDIRVATTSMAEQVRNLESVLDQTSRIDTLIEKTQHHVALAKERRAALVTAAVTGQIDVHTTGRARQGATA